MRQRKQARTHRLLPAVALLALIATAIATTVASARPAAPAAETVKVGLITKDVTNPFFVKMKAGATAAAKKYGAQLIYAAGKSSSDNASQIAASSVSNDSASRVKPRQNPTAADATHRPMTM